MPTTVIGRPLSVRSRPTSAGSAANRLRQKPSLSTATVGSVVSSPGRNVRPRSGLTPRTSKNEAVTVWPGMISGVPSAPVIVGPPPVPGIQIAAIDSNVLLRVAHSRKFSNSIRLRACCCGPHSSTITRRSGSRNGSGRNKAASARANIALLAPMPSASVSAAASAKPGEAFNCRTARPQVSSELVEPLRQSHSRSLFRPRSTHCCFSRPTSPSRASTISRAVRGATPLSTNSLVRISMWKSISSSTSCSSGPRQSHERSERFISPCDSRRVHEAGPGYCVGWVLFLRRRRVHSALNACTGSTRAARTAGQARHSGRYG